MLEIKPVSDVMLAFPATVVRDGYLPAMDSIPKEFHKEATTWNDLFAKLFYFGGIQGQDLYMWPKAGVDSRAAWRQINACMGSFEPKHEHKVAGVAYMLSEWFEKYEWRNAKDMDQKGSKVFFAERKD